MRCDQYLAVCSKEGKQEKQRVREKKVRAWLIDLQECKPPVGAEDVRG